LTSAVPSASSIDRGGNLSVRYAGLLATKLDEPGAIMSQYFRQFRHGDGDAARGLRERLARKELGDAAYDEAVSHYDDRAFRIFGVVFIVLLAVAVLAIAWLGS
jgi:hypothetical protein